MHYLMHNYDLKDFFFSINTSEFLQHRNIDEIKQYRTVARLNKSRAQEIGFFSGPNGQSMFLYFSVFVNAEFETQITWDFSGSNTPSGNYEYVVALLYVPYNQFD